LRSDHSADRREEVEAGEVEGPSGLPPVQLLGRHEVLQVLVVCPDLALMFCALDKVPPLLEGSDDRQHLLVVDLIVLLNRGQGLGEEGDQVPLFVFRKYLEEDRTSRKVGTVGFDAEEFGWVGRDEDRSGSASPKVTKHYLDIYDLVENKILL